VKSNYFRLFLYFFATLIFLFPNLYGMRFFIGMDVPHYNRGVKARFANQAISLEELIKKNMRMRNKIIKHRYKRCGRTIPVNKFIVKDDHYLIAKLIKIYIDPTKWVAKKTKKGIESAAISVIRGAMKDAVELYNQSIYKGKIPKLKLNTGVNLVEARKKRIDFVQEVQITENAWALMYLRNIIFSMCEEDMRNNFKSAVTEKIANSTILFDLEVEYGFVDFFPLVKLASVFAPNYCINILRKSRAIKNRLLRVNPPSNLPFELDKVSLYEASDEKRMPKKIVSFKI